MRTRTEILQILRNYKPIAESKYGLTRLGIFGSVARGEQTEDSDVDVYYEGRVPSLLTLDLIQSDLERLIGCHVDMVRLRENMNILLKERIQKEGLMYDNEIVIDSLQKIRNVIETIEDRFAVVSSPDELLSSPGGMMRLDAICMNLIAVGEAVKGLDKHDEKFGGAFLIMNSCGETWGENGFTWVTYSDYAKTVEWAYEMYVRKVPKPSPTPEIQKNSLVGSLQLQLSTGEMMIPKCKVQKGLTRYYSISDSYISGTRYRIYLTNNEPAFVYVIGSDNKNNVSKVFPPNDNVSAALTYKANHIAIPDETYYVEMDDTEGKDYMCVLYSLDELNIDNIIVEVKDGKGSFYEKVMRSISDKVAPMYDINYLPDSIGFEAKTEKKLVPLFVEWKHK